MTDVSLKERARNCLSTTPDMSVLRDVFGYRRGAPEDLSLANQIDRVSGQSFGLNVILVCPDAYDQSDLATLEEAIQSARDLYAQRDVGIRGVEWYEVPSDRANGHCNLGDDGSSAGEATALTDDWTVDNDFMDLFITDDINPKDGWSGIDGPCDKDGPAWVRSGSVLEMMSRPQVMGVLLAHELGHYFGLTHTSATNNFMNPTVGSNSTNISASQAQTIKDKDCFTSEVC